MDPCRHTDSELLAGFMSGSTDCFDEFISRYERKVFALSLYLTDNESDAEQVLADVFTQLSQGSEQESENIAGSVYRLALSACDERLKTRNEKGLVVEKSHIPEPVWSQSDADEFDCEEEWDRALSEQVLKDTIYRLPVEYRKVFLLHELSGLSDEEIAQVLSISLWETKATLHRARLMLRRGIRQLIRNASRTDQVIADNTEAIRPEVIV